MRTQKLRALTGALLLGAAACTDGFFAVSDPDVLETDNIDPERDGETLARSAFQNFMDAYGDLAVYSAWWSHEARVGDTFPTRNEFGRRFIDDTNGTLTTETWQPIARAASTGEQLVATLSETRGLPLAIAAFAEAYALVLMAETFCDGTVTASTTEPGSRLDTQQMLDRAIERFGDVRTEAASLDDEEATALATASLVGIARAHLFAGRNADAFAAARQVPAGFVFELRYVDDPANRDRVGNNVWNFSLGRQSLVVPPEYIALADGGDPRIDYEDTGRLAQDSELQFYRQLKFPGYDASMRLASDLEARYIAAEASGDIVEQIALINERRAVGNQGPFDSTDPAAVLAELMDQKSRDFWLEARKMGDFRRNGHAVPYVLPDNSEYYKPGVGAVGTQQCWPVPDDETKNNPNW